jgi:hypothetical protein
MMLLWSYVPFPDEKGLFHYASIRFGNGARAHKDYIARFAGISPVQFDAVRRTVEFRAWEESFARVKERNNSFQKKRTVDEMEGGGDEPNPKKTKGTFPPEKELR